MTLCITHEPNHPITRYRTPFGNLVCDHCGAYCTCNEDHAKCELCDTVEHYESMVDGFTMLPEILDALNLGYHDYLCLGCYELQAVKHDQERE